MLLVVIALGIYLVIWMRTESYQCLSNPYTYSIGLLEKANNADVTCICKPNKKDGLSVILDRNGFRKLFDDSPLEFTTPQSINLSTLT